MKFAICLAPSLFLLACSSSSNGGSPTGGQDAGGADASDAGEAIDAYTGVVTEHGIELDYTNLTPVAGLTVSDNGMTATTDATGAWSITLPAGTALLSPTVTGPMYTNTIFPQSVPAAADVDFAQSVIASSEIYSVEQSGLSTDTSKALVQIVVVTAPTCASAEGGTIKVLSPSGTALTYFSKTSLPDNTITSFQAVTAPRPVAVVDNIPLGENLSVAITHPTCKQADFPFTYNGRTYTGVVPTKAAEPGDNNSALVMMLE